MKVLRHAVWVAAAVAVAVFSPYCLLLVAETTGSAWAAFAALALLEAVAVGWTASCLLKSSSKAAVAAGMPFLLTAGFYCWLFYAPTVPGADYTAPTGEIWSLENGSRIAYAEFRDSVTKPYPVVFLHGGAGAPVNGTEPLAGPLAEAGYDVYQYDQAGCGNSARSCNPEDYSCARHVEDLELIRRRIGAQRLILISHSWGGTLAASYMAAYPDRVANSVFISPGSIWYGADVKDLTDDGAADQNSVIAGCPRLIAAFVLAGLGHIRGLYVLFPERNLDNLYMEMHDMLNMKPGSGEFYNSKGSGYSFWANYVAGVTNRRMPCPYPALASTNSRNLVIKGQYDYVSMESTMLFCEKIPGTVLDTVPGMGHSVEPEFEDIVAKKVIGFLSEENNL